MAGKTQGVKTLVQDVLTSRSSKPYGQDIILEVCVAIKNNGEWRKRYDTLKADLSRDIVNNWIGKYTKALTGMKCLGPAKAPEGSLITAYTRLG